MPDFQRPPEPSWNVEPVMSEIFARLDEIAAVPPSERRMLAGASWSTRTPHFPHAHPPDDVDMVFELRAAGSCAATAPRDHGPSLRRWVTT